jgi:hypothetical protein
VINGEWIRAARLPAWAAAFVLAGCSQVSPVIEEQSGLRDPEWQEAPTELPPPPQEENLIALEPSRLEAGYRILIDEKSLSRTGDDVMRYTVVIRSAAGAQTIRFEGMRCATRETKVFAYGGGRGGFRKTLNAPWEIIRTLGVNGYRWVLFDSYMCSDAGGPIRVQDVRRNLRR